MADEPINGTGFSTKEMLVRIDAKVDYIASKQATSDVELALLKARVEAHEKSEEKAVTDDDGRYLKLEKEIEKLSKRQARTDRRVAYAAGAVSVVVFIANVFGPVLAHKLSGL